MAPEDGQEKFAVKAGFLSETDDRGEPGCVARKGEAITSHTGLVRRSNEDRRTDCWAIWYKAVEMESNGARRQSARDLH